MLDEEYADQLLATVPSGDTNLDREIFRTLGGFKARPLFYDKLAARWTPESDPVDDLHYLIVAVVAGGPQHAAARAKTAEALVGLDAKLAARGIRVEAEWSAVVERVCVELMRLDPEFPAALVTQPGFGRAAHAIFVAHLTPAAKQLASARIFAKIADADDVRWNPTLIDVALTSGDPRAQEVLRRQWKDPALQSVLFPIFLHDERPNDLPRFVECLTNPRPDIVRRAAHRLQRADVKLTVADLAAAVRGLRQMCTIPAAHTARIELTTLLGLHLKKTFGIIEPTRREMAEQGHALRDAYYDVFLEFKLQHPQAAMAERSPGRFNPKKWALLQLSIDWDEGDLVRGRALFEKKQCNRCHLGGSRLGPDLDGATARYSRSDLFTTVFEPSRFVPATYRPTTIELASGRAYTGIPAHDTTGVTLLQTGADTTVRVLGTDVATKLESTSSIMPVGLLDDFQPRDFADLYAFLKSLPPRAEEDEAPTKTTDTTSPYSGIRLNGTQ